jgi:hypothetical protein
MANLSSKEWHVQCLVNSRYFLAANSSLNDGMMPVALLLLSAVACQLARRVGSSAVLCQANMVTYGTTSSYERPFSAP